MHSRFDPSKEGSRFATSIASDPNSIHCMLGLGALHHIQSAIDQFADKLQPLIFWEPIPEIANDRNFNRKLDQIKITLQTIGVPYLQLNSNENKAIWRDKVVSFLKETKRKSFEVLAFPSYTRIVPNEIHEFIRFLNEIAASRNGINAQTKSHFQKIWTHNYLKNIEILKETKSQFYLLNKIQFNNRIPVFVGASPTLEKEIESLKKARDKIVLLSSDTSVQYLISSGLVPDAILSFDSGRGTLYHFLPEIPKSIPIITWLGGMNYLFTLPNPIFLINTDFPMDQIVAYKQKEFWPSISNPSLNLAGMGRALAEFANAAKFALAGVSFTDESGKSHCKGTGYETYRIPMQTRKLPWEKLNQNRMYVKREGKNQLAWDKIWEIKENFRILAFTDMFADLQKIEFSPTEADSFFQGFKGFPELDRQDWERAFQEFPDVIPTSTFRHWFST